MSDEEKGVTASTDTIEVSPNVKEPNEWAIPSVYSDFKKRYNSLISALDEEKDYIDFLQDHQNELVIYFAIANELIKNYTCGLYTEKIIKDFQDCEDINEKTVVNQLSRKDIVQHLKHFKIIEGELKEKIENVHDYRDRLVHTPKKRHKITNLEKLEERIKEAEEVISYLNQMKGK